MPSPTAPSQTLHEYQLSSPGQDFNSIASILTETLSKLKRPNKHFLKPLQHTLNNSQSPKIFQEKSNPPPVKDKNPETPKKE
jgi:hypothetical protein